MSEEKQLAVAQPKPRASQILATLMGMEASAMLDTIKAQCFKGNPQNISDAQLAAFVSIAAEMGVNPLLPGMLYAYPDRGAIFPIMGPDGVFKKLAENNTIDSWKTTVYPEDVTLPPTHATTEIWRKCSDRPLSYTALMSEWKVAQNPNWNSRPRHMLGLRSLKHAARMVIHGIPGDEDDRMISEINVTPQAEAPARPPAPAREKKGAAAVKENLTPAIDAKAEIVPEKTPAAAEAESVSPPAKVTGAGPKGNPGLPAAADQSKPIAARTSLADGEKFTAKVEIVEFVAKIAKVGGLDTPVVRANVRGDYEGAIVHINGAKVEDGKVVAPPTWQIERPVIVELFGKLNKVTNNPVTQVYSIREVDAKPDPMPDEY